MDRQANGDGAPRNLPIARRSLLRGIGAGAIAMGAGGIVSACSSGIKGAGGPATGGTITSASLPR